MCEVDPGHYSIEFATFDWGDFGADLHDSGAMARCMFGSFLSSLQDSSGCLDMYDW